MKLIARFRIALAYLLMVVFSLVALPRELWHHCEHQSLDIQNVKDTQPHLTVAQELCSICAIQIASFIAPVYWEKQIEIVLNHLRVSSLYATEEFTLSSTLRLRGPPIFIPSFRL